LNTIEILQKTGLSCTDPGHGAPENPEQRVMIWEKAFPDKAPKETLPPQLLAQLNIPGASLRSIALSVAFLAAAEKKTIFITSAQSNPG
jgi:hypothetical protein